MRTATAGCCALRLTNSRLAGWLRSPAPWKPPSRLVSAMGLLTRRFTPSCSPGSCPEIEQFAAKAGDAPAGRCSIHPVRADVGPRPQCRHRHGIGIAVNMECHIAGAGAASRQECRLLAPLGPADGPDQCPVLGLDRTWPSGGATSQFGPKATFDEIRGVPSVQHSGPCVVRYLVQSEIQFGAAGPLTCRGLVL